MNPSINQGKGTPKAPKGYDILLVSKGYVIEARKYDAVFGKHEKNMKLSRSYS